MAAIRFLYTTASPIKMQNNEVEAKQESKDAPACCLGCIRWERFGKNCWYYWEGKKHCTMWTNDIEELSRQDILI